MITTLRKPRKRKIIKVAKNQQELAQDKLFQISYLSQDKFVDQSQVLLMEHMFPDRKKQKQQLAKQLKSIIDRSRHETLPSRRIHTQTAPKRSDLRRLSSNHSKNQLFILNKLQSAQVFVGFKPRNGFQLNRSQNNCLMIDQIKKMSSTFNAARPSFPTRKMSTQLSDKMDLCIMTESKVNQFRSLHVKNSTRMDEKSKYKQNLDKLKQKMRKELFLHRTAKLKTVE